MQSPILTTIIKMIESLPEEKQEQVLNHLYEYITELYDEIKWDILFKNSQEELSKIAKEVRKDIAEGKIEDFDYDKLWNLDITIVLEALRKAWGRDKETARKAFKLWKENPFHPSLHFKCVDSEEEIWSLRITKGYRALCLYEKDLVVWFWIGNHDDYERLIKKK